MPGGKAMARDTTLLTQRRTDEDELTQAILALGVKYGQYGYRRITALLQDAGWQVGKYRVQRIWRREGLKVPQKQRPRGRLWMDDGSCIRLRPERANHVWSYDFVKAMTHDGRALRILMLIDEYTRECLALRVARRLGSYACDRNLGGCDVGSRDPGAHSFGQWAGVHCRRVAEVAGESWARGRYTSSRGVRGRTGTVRVSMGSRTMSS